jgi:hypothetical protein
MECADGVSPAHSGRGYAKRVVFRGYGPDLLVLRAGKK